MVNLPAGYPFPVTKGTMSPNYSAGSFRPEGIIIHFTAGYSAESSANWMRNPASKASAHFVVGKMGEIIQLVDLDKKAWHAGSSVWKDKSGASSYTFGIEVDNIGPLTLSGGKMVNVYGKPYDGTVIAARIATNSKDDSKVRYYASYTMAQFESVRKLCDYLCSNFGINPLAIMGHEHVAPARKVDPGPAWSWHLIDDMAGAYYDPFLLQHYLSVLGQNIGEIDGLVGKKTMAGLFDLSQDMAALHGRSVLDGTFDLNNKEQAVNVIKQLRNLRPQL